MLSIHLEDMVHCRWNGFGTQSDLDPWYLDVFYFLFSIFNVRTTSVQYDVEKRTYSYRRNKMQNKIKILDLMYRTLTVGYTYKQYTFVPSHFLPIPVQWTMPCPNLCHNKHMF